MKFELKDKLIATFGTELTWVYSDMKYWDDEEEHEFWEGQIIDAYVVLIKKELYMKKVKTYCIENDGGAVEIATKPYSNINDYIVDYNKINKIVTKFPLIAKHPNKCGGGGHIHFNLDQIESKFNDNTKRKKFIFNLFKDITNRPYLNWIFNEYCDILSSESFILYEEYDGWDFVNYINNNENDDHQLRQLDKGFALRIDDEDHSWDFSSNRKNTTVELRFFDSPSNVKETFEHINFANSYLTYIFNLTKRNKNIDLVVTKRKHLNELIQNDKCISEFKNLIETLGLNWKVYKKYVEMNYDWRKANKTWYAKSF